MAIVSRAAAMKAILPENLPLCHEKEPLRMRSKKIAPLNTIAAKEWRHAE